MSNKITFRHTISLKISLRILFYDFFDLASYVRKLVLSRVIFFSSDSGNKLEEKWKEMAKKQMKGKGEPNVSV